MICLLLPSDSLARHQSGEWGDSTRTEFPGVLFGLGEGIHPSQAHALADGLDALPQEVWVLTHCVVVIDCAYRGFDTAADVIRRIRYQDGGRGSGPHWRRLTEPEAEEVMAAWRVGIQRLSDILATTACSDGRAIWREP